MLHLCARYGAIFGDQPDGYHDRVIRVNNVVYLVIVFSYTNHDDPGGAFKRYSR